MENLNTLEKTVKEARLMRRKAIASASHYKKQIVRYTQNGWSNVHVEQFKSDLRVKAELITQLTSIIDKGVNRIKLMKEIAKLKAEVATRQNKLSTVPMATPLKAKAIKIVKKTVPTQVHPLTYV